MIQDHATYAFILALTTIVGIVVLAAVGHTVPTVLSDIAVGSTVGGAALARQGGK